jgi:hypothetical protein
MTGLAICTLCGNEVDATLTKCPYCGEKRTPEYTGAGSESLRIVNLERGMPPVKDAVIRLATELANSRSAGFRIMVFIHGYGSSGSGGAIKEAVRQKLHGHLVRKEVADVLRGEDCHKNSSRVKKILKRFPGAKDYVQRCNPGILTLQNVSNLRIMSVCMI